ncbi:hypothetical protein C8F04DRAFT_1182615 [Mycena alexandri]|uniref:Uncharacterized protein n=1 Tax=Mycena alexandri TaxID=1745969 RepID=A0AAD6SW94_9AGAR|nr:hypothetical protein C8F04DRAFT_1182615 [Mycena alexandri]
MGLDGTAPQSATDGFLWSRDGDRTRSSADSTMILLSLTTIIPAAVAALPGLSRPTPFLIDLKENCRFRVGSRAYDLCPLFGPAPAEKRPLLVKAGPAEYRIHFGLEDGNRDPGSSRDLGSPCPPGTRIRLLSDESHRDIPISGDSSIITVDLEDSDEALTLQLGGDRGGAVLRLVCDPCVEVGQPTLSGVENSLHSFVWRTKFGCESGTLASYSIHALDSESDTNTPPTDDTSNPSNPDDESEQLLEGDKQRRSRFFRRRYPRHHFVRILIISLSIISYKHPDRLNFLLAEHIKPLLRRISFNNIHLPHISVPHPLKPAGEGRLVLWAHEDLELDEDIMVNGSDAYDEPDEADDESIPLRPSLRKGGRAVKNYGSATSPFW